LTELRRLGRTLTHRAGAVLAYFDRPGTSNGPAEAINGRLEHLRGSALGFRNLATYIARSLLESGGFRPQLHLNCEEPAKGMTFSDTHYTINVRAKVEPKPEKPNVGPSDSVAGAKHTRGSLVTHSRSTIWQGNDQRWDP